VIEQPEFPIAKSLPAGLCLAGDWAVVRAPLHWEEQGSARAASGREVVRTWGCRLPNPAPVVKQVQLLLWK